MRTPRTLAELWAIHAQDFTTNAVPMTIEHARVAFYLGAIAYSDLLREGIAVRKEVENFLATHPLIYNS